MNRNRRVRVYDESRLQIKRPLPNIPVPQANMSSPFRLNDFQSTSAKQNTYVPRASGIRFDLTESVTHA